MNRFKKLTFIGSLLLMILTIVSCQLPANQSEITISIVDEDNIVIESIVTKKGEETTLDPQKEGHTLEGLYLDGELIEMPYVFEEDTVVMAKFIANMYTYKFIVDGIVIKEETLPYNSTIVYPKNPTKESTDETSYEFIGWDNQAGLLVQDEVFNAKFVEVERIYTYTFLDDLGNVIATGNGVFGSVINYPENPTKESTEKYNYVFDKWDIEPVTLTENVTITASFKEEIRKYTYSFLDANGNVITSSTEEYGTTIVYPENPVKDATAEYNYTFERWDCDETVLVQDITFKPVFKATKNQYTYRFLDDDGTILKEETVDYGVTAVAPNNPQKEGYKFVGWDKTIGKVVENIDYIARYEEKVPVTSLDGLKVSILGDSISTFYQAGSEMNSYYSGTNQFYYPTYSSTIKTVNLTWWYKLIKNNNMTLGINNSWSGSCAYGTSSSAGQTDGRINTLDQNGMPDIVIIYLGTNDCATGYTTNQFKEAIETIVNKIRALGDTEIFITTLGYSAYTGMNYSDELRVEYNQAIREVASNKECGVVPLDEYIVDNSYMFYLGDNLHYNAKGAELLSQIYEKSIKEYYGIEYNDTIKVEYQEKLPEGITGIITATSNGDFWAGYITNVFLGDKSFTNPLYSHRIELTLGSDGVYYVSNIQVSGQSTSFTGDLVIIISDSHESNKALLDAIADVKVGNIVEFNSNMEFPLELTFKEGSNTEKPNPDPVPDPSIEGMLYVGAYNEGVWTKYDSTVIAYSDSKMDKGSTYVNFYVISLTKDEAENTYVVSALKPINETMSFTQADYYILIFSTLEQVSFYNNANVGDKVVIHGDITTGSCNLEFN